MTNSTMEQVLEMALESCRAAVAYDAAIKLCANDPEKMSSFCTAQDETLDDLYFDWLNKSRNAIAAARGIPSNV